MFEDRFGRQITEPEVLKFFGWLADNKLLDEESAAHPCSSRSPARAMPSSKDWSSRSRSRSWREDGTQAGATKPAARRRRAARRPRDEQKSIAEEATLPAGVNEAENLDPRWAGGTIPLFEIRPLLALLLPVVRPLRWVVYLLPFLFLSALILSVRYAPLGYDDLATLHDLTDLAVHALVSLFTINIAAVLTQAFVAQNFRATVGPLSIGFRFGFFPRFTVRIRHTDQLSRRERMWLHAGPLLMRLFLFSAGILVWYNTRDKFLFVSRAGAVGAFLCAVTWCSKAAIRSSRATATTCWRPS